MPQNNAELVARFIAHVNDNEMDAALEYVDPDGVLDWTRSEAPDGGIHRGRDAWARWMMGRWEGLVGARFAVRELVDVPPDRVLMLADLQGQGRASGLETEALGAGIVEIVEGVLTRITLFQTRADAVRAAGLEEQIPGREAPAGTSEDERVSADVEPEG
ncbi:MAG TPA: nuclear transport factor 2 family protein [Gemmatimonadales bacterium]|nr:nuclear transport factor 2 family protein [Gemmatimonadales bacterium]